jgi:16S rRNA (cytosine967-C5)-methyltransferase
VQGPLGALLANADTLGNALTEALSGNLPSRPPPCGPLSDPQALDLYLQARRAYHSFTTDSVVVDYCAGGGGKTLAMAARADLRLWAHDAAPRRMVDLPVRAARAGAAIIMTQNPFVSAPYDLILTDVPCSGSGSWRRDPQGKWALTLARLAELTALQAQILDTVVPMLHAAGTLAYATCSLLREENEAQIAAFLGRHPGWRQISAQRFTPLQGGDGFFLALLTRNTAASTQP